MSTCLCAENVSEQRPNNVTLTVAPGEGNLVAGRLSCWETQLRRDFVFILYILVPFAIIFCINLKKNNKTLNLSKDG